MTCAATPTEPAKRRLYVPLSIIRGSMAKLRTAIQQCKAEGRQLCLCTRGPQPGTQQQPAAGDSVCRNEDTDEWWSTYEKIDVQSMGAGHTASRRAAEEGKRVCMCVGFVQ